MPLKIGNLSHPSSTTILNRWADTQETTQNTHTQLIQQLQTQINELQNAKTAK